MKQVPCSFLPGRRESSRPKNKGITKRKTGVKPVKSREIGTSQFFHKIISTQPLTVLIISVILRVEQRKRDKKKEKDINPLNLLNPVPRNKVNSIAIDRKGEMTYVNA